MAASALTTATASALSSTLPDNSPKSNQQSPRHTATTSTVAVRAGAVEVSKALQDGEKFIKWDEVSAFTFTFLISDKQVTESRQWNGWTWKSWSRRRSGSGRHYTQPGWRNEDWKVKIFANLKPGAFLPSWTSSKLTSSLVGRMAEKLLPPTPLRC